MPEEKQQPENSAYVLAWLILYFAISIPALVLATMLYMVNMFAEILPVYWAFYGYAAGLVALHLTMLGIAATSWYCNCKGRSAWVPRPIPAIAKKAQGIVELLR